jgi:hypothetical protein
LVLPLAANVFVVRLLISGVAGDRVRRDGVDCAVGFAPAVRFVCLADRAAAARVRALSALGVFERLFVTYGTRLLSRGCDGSASSR